MSLDRTTRAVVLAMFLACLAGCGVSAYEERLAKTDQRNRHFAKLDTALDGYWNHASYGIWLRPPKGMVNVPAPAKPKDGEEEAPDLRQEFQGVPLDLPGIIQVWDGLLPTAGGGTGPYRLCLLGNHSRFARSETAGESTDPKTYFYDLELVLQNLYGVMVPPGDGGRSDANNERFRTQIPNAEQFAVPKAFVAINFVPLQEGQQPFHAWLFEHTTGQVQFAVLMLTPTAASNEVRQNLITSLETLQVSSQTPGLQAGGRRAPLAAEPSDLARQRPFTMSQGRTIAIGDIHGCCIALGTLLTAIQPVRDDTLVILGDVIDRGPQTRDCVDLLLALRTKCRVVHLMGNHEEMFLDALAGGPWTQTWYQFGGLEMLASYGGAMGSIPADHMDFFRGGKDYFETDSQIFVHGYLRPTVPVDHELAQWLRWARFQPTEQPHTSGKRVICGHTAQPSGRPLGTATYLCLDTCAYCPTGALSALDVDRDLLWQATQAGELRDARPLAEVLEH